MKLLFSVSLLHLNLTIQRRSALTSRTTHHPLSNILTLIALHACRVFTNIVKREGGPPAFEGRYKYISFTRFIDDGKRELERPTTKSGAFGPPPYLPLANRDDRLAALKTTAARLTPYGCCFWILFISFSLKCQRR